MYSYTRLSRGTPHLVALYHYLSVTRLFDACSMSPDFAADERLLRTFDLLGGSIVPISRGMLRGYMRLVVPLGAPAAVAVEIAGDATFLVQHAGLSFTGAVAFQSELPSVFVLDTYGVADADTCANAPSAFDARYCWSLCVHRRRSNGAVRVAVRPGGCLLMRCARDVLNVVRAPLGEWRPVPAPVAAHDYTEVETWWQTRGAADGGASAVAGFYCETPRGERAQTGGFSLDTLADVECALAGIQRTTDLHQQASTDEARSAHNSPSFLTSSDHEAVVEQTVGFFDMDVGFFDSPEWTLQSRRDEEAALRHVRFDTRDPAAVCVTWDGIAGWFFLLAPARAAAMGCSAIIMFLNRCFYRLIVPAAGEGGELRLLAHEVSAAATHRLEDKSRRLGYDVVCRQLRSLLGAESGPHRTMTLFA